MKVDANTTIATHAAVPATAVHAGADRRLRWVAKRTPINGPRGSPDCTGETRASQRRFGIVSALCSLADRSRRATTSAAAVPTPTVNAMTASPPISKIAGSSGNPESRLAVRASDNENDGAASHASRQAIVAL